MWSDDVLSAAAAEEARAPAAQNIPQIAPAAPVQDTTPTTNCPRCGVSNRADTQFCTNCAQTITVTYRQQPSSVAPSIALAIAASLGFTFAGVAAWVLLAYFIGWFWMHFLAVGIGALAGYGLVVATDKRGPHMGLLAVTIALIGIVSAKLAIANWVILPQTDSLWQNASTLTEKQVDAAMQNPDALFMYACQHLADEFGWDWQFTNKVMSFHLFKEIRKKHPLQPQIPSDEVEELRYAVKKVQEEIDRWSETEKKEVIISGFAKFRESLKDGAKAVSNAIAESNEPGKRPPAFVTEAFEVIGGDKAFSESKVGRAFALGGSCCCLDIIWIPLALWLAYRTPARRE
jgi:hypothetical protein